MPAWSDASCRVKAPAPMRRFGSLVDGRFYRTVWGGIRSRRGKAASPERTSALEGGTRPHLPGVLRWTMAGKTPAEGVVVMRSAQAR